MKKLVVILVAFLSTAAAAFGAERPDIKVGDTWTYSRTDLWTNVKDLEWTDRVVEIDEQTIKTVRERVNGSSATSTYNKELNLLESAESTGAITKYSPYRPRYKFPLEVGKSWDGNYKMSINGGDRQFRYQMDVRVLGTETVTVPAGTFETFKIEMKGYYNAVRGTGSWSGSTKYIYWYSPDVKASVKINYEDTTGVRQYNKLRYELVRYSVN